MGVHQFEIRAGLPPARRPQPRTPRLTPLVPSLHRLVRRFEPDDDIGDGDGKVIVIEDDDDDCGG